MSMTFQALSGFFLSSNIEIEKSLSCAHFIYLYKEAPKDP